jgi:glyoxylase-like metal-dependent hydrolase (beta-lactamase superfamily II)
MAGSASIARSLTPLEKLGRLDLLAGEARLTDEITAIHTPGHTPGHMSIVIASAGEKALITGDVLSNPAQVSEPDWVPIFDADGAEAAATRRALLDRIEAEGMTVAAGHFPHPSFGSVVRIEGRRYWRAL